ncbi:MAG: RNA-directed DNA polymerase, partial [Arthrospira platensis]
KNIKGNLKSKPLRRVWIPKPGRDDKSWNRNTHNPR